MSSDRGLGLSESFWKGRIGWFAREFATSSVYMQGRRGLRVLWCISNCTALPSSKLALLRTSHTALSLAHLVACAHENLAQPLLLPWRKD
jgi:hypothetical protein